VRTRVGQLIVGGFEGTELPESYRAALARGERAGAILFSRNLRALEQVVALNAAILAARPDALIAVDQEGGRVARLRPPFPALPPMRILGTIDDLALSERAGAALGKSLAALGFNLDFAPVMDVDTNPDNPVIGDRAFGRDPALVARHGVAFLRGLERFVHGCAKHFPGHGDTDLDSHFALPRVTRSRDSLAATELPPFAAAARAGVASMMSAHVVYDAFDAERPATLAPSIATDLLRGELAFEGALFSDDLLMAAVAKRDDPGGVAVEAVAAGCDALLVCRDEAIQEVVLEALAREAETNPIFRDRVEEASSRVEALAARRAMVDPDWAEVLAEATAIEALVEEARG
jgi:beta-N-acetylhexosaminidase